jgi:hypothetical protein
MQPRGLSQLLGPWPGRICVVSSETNRTKQTKVQQSLCHCTHVWWGLKATYLVQVGTSVQPCKQQTKVIGFSSCNSMRKCANFAKKCPPRQSFSKSASLLLTWKEMACSSSVDPSVCAINFACLGLCDMLSTPEPSFPQGRPLLLLLVSMATNLSWRGGC